MGRNGRRCWRAAIVVTAGVALLLPAGASAATADLAITKADSPDPVKEGGLLTYTISVSNLGPGTATGVTVTDDLPSQVDFVSATASQGTCDQKGKKVTCALGNLAANPYGQAATVTITVRPKKAGQIVNTASVAVGQGDTDPNAANNSATTTTTVVAAGGGGGGGGGGAGAACAGRAATQVGTAGADVLVGTSKRDVIVARGGNDRVRGLSGKDIVCGGGGRDRIKGGAGDDRLKGGAGRDTLRGGGGDDRLFGGGGRDRCSGGPGNDTEHSC